MLLFQLSGVAANTRYGWLSSTCYLINPCGFSYTNTSIDTLLTIATAQTCFFMLLYDRDEDLNPQLIPCPVIGLI